MNYRNFLWSIIFSLAAQSCFNSGQLQARNDSLSTAEKAEITAAVLRSVVGVGAEHADVTQNNYKKPLLLATYLIGMTNDSLAIYNRDKETHWHEYGRIVHDLLSALHPVMSLMQNGLDNELLDELNPERYENLVNVLRASLPLLESAGTAYAMYSRSETTGAAQKNRCLAQGCASLAHYIKEYLRVKDNPAVAYARLSAVASTIGLMAYQWQAEYQDQKFENKLRAKIIETIPGVEKSFAVFDMIADADKAVIAEAASNLERDAETIMALFKECLADNEEEGNTEEAEEARAEALNKLSALLKSLVEPVAKKAAYVYSDGEAYMHAVLSPASLQELIQEIRKLPFTDMFVKDNEAQQLVVNAVKTLASLFKNTFFIPRSEVTEKELEQFISSIKALAGFFDNVGTFSINKIFALIASDDAFSREFGKDLFGKLRQSMLSARERQELLWWLQRIPEVLVELEKMLAPSTNSTPEQLEALVERVLREFDQDLNKPEWEALKGRRDSFAQTFKDILRGTEQDKSLVRNVLHYINQDTAVFVKLLQSTEPLAMSSQNASMTNDDARQRTVALQAAFQKVLVHIATTLINELRETIINA